MHEDDPIATGDDLARLQDPMLEAVELAGEGVEAEPDLFELELDGVTHTLPAALKGAFMRQADYTRKTQELAEHRRAVEAEREALRQEAASQRAASGDRLRLAALEARLEDFAAIDWDAYAQHDPQRAQMAWQAYQETARAHEQLGYAVAHEEERLRLQAARDAAEAMTETGRRLSREIEGWSPEVAAKLVDYAQAFGVTLEELREAADPRLWKLLHKAWKADQAGQGDAEAQALALRPAVTVSGGGGASDGPRDTLATKEWMRRRNAQVARGR